MTARFFTTIFGMLLLIQTASIFAQSDPNDRAGTKDPPIFSRMKGFYIDNYEEKEFDKFEFQVSSDKSETVEGHFYHAQYWANDGITVPSGLQIVRNYVNAAKAIGGKQIYSWDDGGAQCTVIKIVKDKVETWVHIYAPGNNYSINIVQKELMNQDVVANAASLANSIKESGKVSVYGIYFDTDKATLKPESIPALNEIAKMMKDSPDMKLYVVGHTDNSGTFDHNLKLSKDRADSVVKELTTKYSISVSRLLSFGAGPTSPAASNSTEEGKAKNRRVELVAQ